MDAAAISLPPPAGPYSLRIAVVFGDTVLEERTVALAARWASSMKNTRGTYGWL